MSLRAVIMKSVLVEKSWLWIRLLVTSAATLALFNYPRTWWQEVICASSSQWSVVFLIALCLDLVRFQKISWSFLRAILVALQILCITRTGQIVMPYLYAKQKSYPQLLYSDPTRFLFIDISERTGNAQADALNAFIHVEDPSMEILTRYTDTPKLAAVADRFPHRFISRTSDSRVVEIFSKLKVREPIRLDAGYAALPAVMSEFLTSEGYPFMVGAFDLLPPYNQEDFLRSRLTSRRVASYLKYSTKPRMVFGAFRTSVTSQIVDMYAGQLHLRALSFDSGISIVPDIMRQSGNFDKVPHVFTARRIQISRIIESKADDDGFSAVLFDARIPLAGW